MHASRCLLVLLFWLFASSSFVFCSTPNSLMDDDSPSETLERNQLDIAKALRNQPVRRLVGSHLKHGITTKELESDSFSASPSKYHGESSRNAVTESAAVAAVAETTVERFYEAGFGSCGIPDIASDDECVADLAAFPELAARSGSSRVRRLACLAHSYLRPWMGIPGVKKGMGARGMISPRILHRMGRMANVLSCSGHVRIVNGKIFFRFGGFEFHWYRMRRFVFSILMIKDAIETYNLHSLNAEFYLSTCDLHISKAASIADRRAGLPIFSPHGAPGSIDILYPDPVDLSASYFRSGDDAVPWELKQSRAVFRGGMTNFRVSYDRQWRASPRFRVHRMSDVRPDLLDAKVVTSGLKSTVDAEFQDSLRDDGIEMGNRLGPSELQGYKYELDVDGGTGSGRVCGILSSNQMLIKQGSEYTQFFDPLLCPNRHFVSTHRYFSNLFERIQWARDHDNEAQRIVKQANRLASEVCSWEGRRLYWAILLAKYSASALEDPANVTRPVTFQCKARPTQNDVENNSIRSKPKPAVWPPKCNSPDDDTNQPACTHFCAGNILETKWKWLTADLLDDIEVFKPRNSRIQFREV
ncbi:hypothetical protein CLOP_g23369 [Closterium sp. NIES-67]|nr:hypothetical protein CLOP_g23369 [Closterium sp. NIES-67]